MRMAKGTSHSVAWLFLRSHLGRIQASSIPNLVEDYVRFILAFFEIINISAPHIYHSALPLSPRTSITREVYKKHASPLVRVVQGMPDSWERVVATTNLDRDPSDAIWSPCNRFIALATSHDVRLLDAITLSRLCVFKKPRDRQLGYDLQRLGFSPDGRFLATRANEEFISWDLQTGGQLCIISQADMPPESECLSFKHSEDGKMITAAFEHWNKDKSDYFIYTYDLLSGKHVGPHHIPEGRIIYPIWTHDEYFLFATIDPRSIRIWQSSFTSEHPPVEVTSLPVPDGIADAQRFLLLPSLSRLAFVLGGAIQVWDLKVPPKLLLKSELVLDPGSRFNPIGYNPPCGSFTSDGRFFAYTNAAEEVCILKESPTGYLLHQRLQFFSLSFPELRLSPSGESIILLLGSKFIDGIQEIKTSPDPASRSRKAPASRSWKTAALPSSQWVFPQTRSSQQSHGRRRTRSQLLTSNPVD